MKISVITVVLNNQATLEQTIQSVQTQSHGQIEHIIVDGGSDDGSQQIIGRYARQLQILIEPDSGIYDAMNKGLSMASGDVVGFLNADDFFAHDHVLKKISEQFDDANLDACYADLNYVRHDDINHVVRYWRSCDYQPGLFEKGWMPAHPTFYVRRSVYEKLGGFKQEYSLQADFELTARYMAVEKIRTRYVPEVWVKMRMGGATNKNIGNILKGNCQSYRACKKLGLKMTPLYFVTKFLMRLPQFYQKQHARSSAHKS